MLEQITPIILTWNEASNIGRTLDPLQWARDIIVVDSLSDDETLDIVARTPQARVFKRRFVSLEDQWNFALRETGIETEWVLALDADYVLTPEALEEIGALRPSQHVAGYRAKFAYCVHGRALRGSAYPPVTVLYRHNLARYRQDGHAHRVLIDGQVSELRSPLLHDDRKPLGRWLRSQDDYMKLETRKLLMTHWSALGWADRIRRLIVPAPLVMFVYCLFVRGAILDGRAGLFYAFQRLLSELLLSLYLIDHGLIHRRQPKVSEMNNEPGHAAAPATADKEGEPVAHSRH
jgi:glycosyltransferase involved in cell wall biosynthesis